MPAASIDFEVPNSPLGNLLLDSARRDDSPPRRAPAPSAARSSNKRTGAHVLPHKYDSRQSNQQLEQLIAQSRSHIGDSLLLDDDGEGSSAGDNGFLMYSGSSSASAGRPLTSAGRKLSSGGSGRANDSLFDRSPDHRHRDFTAGPDDEEEVLIIPSSSSAGSLSHTSPVHAPTPAPELKIYRDPVTDMRRSGGSAGGSKGKYQSEEDEQDLMLSSCGEFHVQCK
jgi:hypothetical protein